MIKKLVVIVFLTVIAFGVKTNTYAAELNVITTETNEDINTEIQKVQNRLVEVSAMADKYTITDAVLSEFTADIVYLSEKLKTIDVLPKEIVMQGLSLFPKLGLFNKKIHESNLNSSMLFIFDSACTMLYGEFYRDIIATEEPRNNVNSINDNDTLIPDEAEEEIISFQDFRINREVRRLINKPEGDLYKDDVIGITELDLSDDDISSINGIEYLINLEVLDLSFNKYIEDYSSLTSLPKLKVLNLEYTNIKDYDLLEEIKNLKSLNLSQNIIKDIGFIKKNINLEELILENMYFTVDITELSSLQKLKKLNLNNNDVKNFSIIKKLDNLEELDLSEVTSISLDAIQNFTKLKILKIGKTNTKSISKLKKLINLIELDINSNPINDIDVLKSFTELTTVDLRGTKITSVAILKDCKKLKSLRLNGINKSVISTLSDVTQLTNLYLEYISYELDLTSLRKLNNLKTLSLYGSCIKDLGAIKDLHKLEELVLESTGTTDITGLSGLRNLKILNLSNYTTNHNSIKSLDALKKLSKLEELYVSCDESLKDISALRELTNLRKLEIEGDGIKDLKPLGNLVNLEYLSLMCDNVSDISFIKDCTRITIIDLSGDKFKNLKPLGYLKKLVGVYLEGGSFNDISVLNEISTLRSFSARYTNLSLKAIVTGLKGLPKMKTISIPDGIIKSSADMKALRKAVPYATIWYR